MGEAMVVLARRRNIFNCIFFLEGRVFYIAKLEFALEVAYFLVLAWRDDGALYIYRRHARCFLVRFPS